MNILRLRNNVLLYILSFFAIFYIGKLGRNILSPTELGVAPYIQIITLSLILILNKRISMCGSKITLVFTLLSMYLLQELIHLTPILSMAMSVLIFKYFGIILGGKFIAYILTPLIYFTIMILFTKFYFIKNIHIILSKRKVTHIENNLKAVLYINSISRNITVFISEKKNPLVKRYTYTNQASRVPFLHNKNNCDLKIDEENTLAFSANKNNPKEELFLLFSHLSKDETKDIQNIVYI